MFGLMMTFTLFLYKQTIKDTIVLLSFIGFLVLLIVKQC